MATDYTTRQIIKADNIMVGDSIKHIIDRHIENPLTTHDMLVAVRDHCQKLIISDF